MLSVVGMTSHRTDSFGRRWAIEFEIFEEQVDIVDVHLDGVQIPQEIISDEWIEKEEDRIACMAFGFQAWS